MSHLLESRLSPKQRAQACAADAAELAAEAAMRNLRRAQAERATLNSAGHAIDAAMRPCFEREFGSYPTLLDVLIADAVIDPAFEYVDVSVPCLSCELTVGFTYDPGSRPAPTSPQFFELTGDPGDPGEGDELIVFEVWVRGIEISLAMSDEANEQIAKAVRAKIAALIVESNEP